MNSNNQFLRGVSAAVIVGFVWVASPWARAADLDEAIRKLRMGTLVLETTPGAEVRVEQLRHEFWS